jgi:hypothetical protein
LGGYEIIIFILSILVIIYSTVIGNVPDYQVISTYVRPVIVEFPQVLMFFLMLRSDMAYRARRNYYRTRFVCLIISILVSVIYAIVVYKMITSNYKVEYCNTRGLQNKRSDYEAYETERKKGYGYLRKYDSYEDWVHNDKSAEACANEALIW